MFLLAQSSTMLIIYSSSKLLEQNSSSYCFVPIKPGRRYNPKDGVIHMGQTTPPGARKAVEAEEGEGDEGILHGQALP